MRSVVAVALVVCGTLLALMPSISDYLHGYQVSQFLADRTVQTGITRIHQPFGETFRAAAWALGAAMIVLGVLGGDFHRPAGRTTRSELESRFGHDMLVGSESRGDDSSRTRSSW